MDLDLDTAPTDDASPQSDSGAPQSGSGTPHPPKNLGGQDWESYRDIIKDLYHRLPLKDVIAYMAERYKFTATPRMYKTRLDQWGLKKYVKKRDMQNLVREVQVKASEGASVPMEFEIDGQKISRTKVARFARRKGQSFDRETSTCATTPSDTNNPSRTSSLSDGWHMLQPMTGQDIGTDSPDAGSPATSDGTSINSPMSLDQPLHGQRTQPRPVPRLVMLSPLVESPEPTTPRVITSTTLAVPDPMHTNGAIEDPCPRAPQPRSQKLQRPFHKDTLEQALLLAIILSAMVNNIPLGTLFDGHLDTILEQITFDTDYLTRLVDLLAWLQLGQEIIHLAITYLFRFNASETFPKSHNVWQQLLVALKFAQNSLDDEPFCAKIWTYPSPDLAHHSIGQASLEMDVLSDIYIHLYISHNDWKLWGKRISHISASVLDCFHQGKLISANAKQHSADRMVMYG